MCFCCSRDFHCADEQVIPAQPLDDVETGSPADDDAINQVSAGKEGDQQQDVNASTDTSTSNKPQVPMKKRRRSTTPSKTKLQKDFAKATTETAPWTKM